ncbi:hypothetical protein, partial [Rhizobium sophoriradicis]|uniref:hypothetical protein n=1 Tax=Rhizobium sophoriradicis TaxID=1535245 RepID=UPI001AEC8C48
LGGRYGAGNVGKKLINRHSSPVGINVQAQCRRSAGLSDPPLTAIVNGRKQGQIDELLPWKLLSRAAEDHAVAARTLVITSVAIP